MRNNAKSKWAGLILMALALGACQSKTPPSGKEIETHRADGVVITLSNDKGELTQGQNQFVVTFRSAADQKPVNAGNVSVNSTMAMPGMAPMTAGIEVRPGAAAGQYLANGTFDMSGSWRFEVRWDGPAGQASTSFNTNVR